MATVDPFCNSIVAHDRGVRAELRKIRDRGYNRAQALFAGHDQPGGAKITKSSGSLDYFWSLEDSDDGKGQPAAAAIEYGHTTKGGKPVEGLHIIKRSAASL